MPRPFVSILIDTYNHELLIEDAINSVLAQDFPPTEREILVVDDGSTDSTPKTLEKFGQSIRVLRKPNGGQGSAFNVGIPECRGEIIAFLDGDDTWVASKLSSVVDVMARDNRIGLVGSGITETYLEGGHKVCVPQGRVRLKLESVSSARIFRLHKAYLGTSRMTLRADLARQILPVPDALRIEADEYLFTMAAALRDIVILNQALTNYRIHGGNLYFSAGSGSPGLRRKQACLAALANALRERLRLVGTAEAVIDCVVEIIQAEADQIRLRLDGGHPWETVRTERKIFEVAHADAPLVSRLFRLASMSMAAILPPQWFYTGREWLNSSTLYGRMRERVVPIPETSRLEGWEEFKQ